MYILRPGASEDQAHGQQGDVELTWNDMNLGGTINKTSVKMVDNEFFVLVWFAFTVHSTGFLREFHASNTTSIETLDH